VLLIGIALSRTIQGYRRHIPAALARGARIRVVLLDPDVADLLDDAAGTARTGSRIRNSLEKLTTAAAGAAGLEIRTIPDPVVSTLNVLNVRSPEGILGVQRHEIHPDVESKPILVPRPEDGY
jgi:hypothetical protein